jgi:hypothetical protein
MNATITERACWVDSGKFRWLNVRSLLGFGRDFVPNIGIFPKYE